MSIPFKCLSLLGVRPYNIIYNNNKRRKDLSSFPAFYILHITNFHIFHQSRRRPAEHHLYRMLHSDPV